jgi:uncharacterized membrane protein YhaH (DUF805 family)
MAKKNHPLIEGLFSFEGRFRRSEYWLASIGIGVVRMVVLLIAGAFMGEGVTQVSQSLPLRIGLDLIFLWPSAAVAVKRGHDRNRATLFTCVLLAIIYATSETATAMTSAGAGTGGLMAGGFVALLMFPVLIYMLIDYGLIDGTKGPNRYGPSPKGHQGLGDELAKTFD